MEIGAMLWQQKHFKIENNFHEENFPQENSSPEEAEQ